MRVRTRERACMRVCVRAYVCVCVCERERERERETSSSVVWREQTLNTARLFFT